MDELNDVRTTCPYCGVGCGIRVTPQADAPSTMVRGDEHHPANFGRLCSKGAALAETLDLEGRLLYPEVHGQRVSWDVALDTVAGGFASTIAEYGPEAVAFYVSGQLLTEDYYVANKLMKGFIGSANIDTNSRLCMSSSVAGHKRAFGADTVPGNYEDFEQAELIVLVGSNLAWCHPVLYQRISAARQANPRLQIVVIDPRRTASCDIANLHLALRPGTDTMLFNGLLVHLHQSDAIDSQFLEMHTDDYWPALRSAREVAPNVPGIARTCGLPEEQVTRFYSLFARTPKTMTVYSQGVNQSSFGTDKVNTIINCHLATGRIGQPGMGPFSVTGQPNAMGGREVGGLANQLAAHMDFAGESIERVSRFWNATSIARRPGLKAVDMFRAVADGHIKAIWIMATNPVVSMPEADAVMTALQHCPLVVVSDACSSTDTMACAHVRLPALTWGEKDGTVTNSERRISRQRAFLPPPGEAHADWWIVTEVARRMGYGDAFRYASPADVFREHAALSGFENRGNRAFDISGLAALSEAEYAALDPLQWPFPAGAKAGNPRLFGHGQFYTANGRARFIPVGKRAPAHPVDSDFPLVLNTGRVRDHWHTMTRTGMSPRLSAHVSEPYAELHPSDAAAHTIADGSLVRVASRWGEVIVRARLSPDQQPGTVFVPMHWSNQFATRGRIDVVVNAAVDPHSGQPESKHTPVCVRPYVALWHGFVLSRESLDFAVDPKVDPHYRVAVRGKGLRQYEIAGEACPLSWKRWARALYGMHEGQDSEWIDYLDAAAGIYRGANIREGRLNFCVFIAPSHELPPRSWLAGLFEKAAVETAERVSLLAGRPGAGQRDSGQVVCSCFGVGRNTIVAAIRGQKMATTGQIGAALKAGTNCGSCIPELQRLIAETSALPVA